MYVPTARSAASRQLLVIEGFVYHDQFELACVDIKVSWRGYARFIFHNTCLYIIVLQGYLIIFMTIAVGLYNLFRFVFLFILYFYL